MSIVPLLNKINDQILNPIIALLFAVALVTFIWGVVKFVAKSGSARDMEEGKSAMLWGIVGMVIMVGVYGIIVLILDTFGIQDPPYIEL